MSSVATSPNSSAASPRFSFRRSADGKITAVKTSVPTTDAGCTDAVKRCLLLCRPSDEKREQQIAKLDAKIKKENAAREKAEKQARLEAERRAEEEKLRIAAEKARIEAENFAAYCAAQDAVAAEKSESENSDDEESESEDDGIDSLIVVSDQDPSRSLCAAAEVVIERMIEANLLMYDQISGKTYARLRNTNIWMFDNDKIPTVILSDGWADIVVKEKTDRNNKKIYIPIKSEIKSFNDFVKFFNLRLPAFQIAKNEERTSLNAFDSITFANRNRVYYIDGYFDLSARRFVTREEDPIATTFVRIERLYNRDAELRAEIQTNVEAHPLVQTLRDKYLTVFGARDNQDYSLKTYARAISGSFDKQFCVCWGGRDAGKGLMETILKSTFEHYVTNFSAPLVKPNSSDAAAANREVLSSKLYLARLAFSNESQDQGSDAKNSRFDTGALKNWASGGDSVICRRMCENETSARVTAMLFMNLNACPKIAADASKTMRLLNFPNTYNSDVLKSAGGFLSTVAKPNENIKREFSTNRSLIIAMEELVYSFYRPNPVRDEDIPDSVRTIREAKFNDDLEGAKKNDLNQIVSELFEPATVTTFIPIIEVYKLIYAKETSDAEARGFSFMTHRADFKRFKAFFDAQKGIISKKSNGVCNYYGIKIREESVDADDFGEQPSTEAATNCDSDLDMDEPMN